MRARASRVVCCQPPFEIIGQPFGNFLNSFDLRIETSSVCQPSVVFSHSLGVPFTDTRRAPEVTRETELEGHTHFLAFFCVRIVAIILHTCACG